MPAPARTRFDETELDELKSRTPLSQVFERYTRLRGAGLVKWCLSPFNAEKTPSCKVDDGKGMFHCFSSGKHGDHYDALQHFTGCSFVEAVEALGGTRTLTPAERTAYEDRRRAAEAAEREKRARTLSSIERAWRSTAPLAGTLGAVYLDARGLSPLPAWRDEIRFLSALDYRGYADEDAEDTVVLGAYPAMVAAIRDASGGLIGLHRTYLALDGRGKLAPPGDAARNKAKKVLGEQTGGMIRLTPLGPRLAIGEGIETVASWYALGQNGEAPTALATGISLGNLAGGCLGSWPHPRRRMRDGRPLPLPDGRPDPDRPGVVLPAEVREVVLLGDGDSDPAMTRARLRVAANRFREQGRAVMVHMAPEGSDWNDVLRREYGVEVAA